MSRVLALRLYKSFLRESRILLKNERSLWLNAPPDFNKFQTSIVLDRNRHISIVKSLLPKQVQHLSSQIKKQCINANELKEICENEFRKQSADNIDTGFEVFRVLRIQAQANKMISVSETNNIRAILSVAYNKMQSQAMTEGYVYYYRVTVENDGVEPIQLMGRHWNFSSNGFITQVPKFADGVIGLQPVIEPGEAFEYMSRVVLNHAEGGTMSGAFLMLNPSTKETFELEISQCNLTPTEF